MATTADPRGSPPDPMFSPCYTSSHHARLILPPLTRNAFEEHHHHHHAASSSAPSSAPVHDEAENEEETQQQPVERPWNLRSRRGSSLRASNSEKKGKGNERARFSVSLSAEEIEEDVYAVTGSRLRRRPKRRPRVVQRQLDALFPGMLLTEITVDSYKVPQS